MKLDFPLIQYYSDGWRTAYLVNIVGDKGRIQPIGAKGTVPNRILVPLSDLRALEPGQPLPTLPANAEELNQKLEQERTKTNMTKTEKKGKRPATSKKEAAGKLIIITDKAPETSSLKEGSHAYAIFKALRAYKGRATREQLLDKIQNEKLVETTMDLSKAFSWMVWQLRGKGFLKIERGESA